MTDKTNKQDFDHKTFFEKFGGARVASILVNTNSMITCVEGATIEDLFLAIQARLEGERPIGFDDICGMVMSDTTKEPKT